MTLASPSISYCNLRHFEQSNLTSINTNLIRGVIDKFNILTSNVDYKFLRSISLNVYPFRTEYYRKATSFNVGNGSFITVFEGPLFQNSLFNFKVEFNPSKYIGGKFFWYHFEGTLGKLGLSFNAIKRIDGAVFCPSDLMPVDLFFQSIRVKGKRRVGRYRDSRLHYRSGVCSGVTLGRSPNRVIVYDVDMEKYQDREEYRKLKKEGKLKFVCKTKFESQMGNLEYVPIISEYEDLNELLSINPFEKVTFFNVFNNFELPRDTMKEKVKELKLISYAHSYHNARALMNKKNRTFHRLEKYIPKLLVGLDQRELEAVISEAYFRDLKNWLLL